MAHNHYNFDWPAIIKQLTRYSTRLNDLHIRSYFNRSMNEKGKYASFLFRLGLDLTSKIKCLTKIITITYFGW